MIWPVTNSAQATMAQTRTTATMPTSRERTVSLTNARGPAVPTRALACGPRDSIMG